MIIFHPTSLTASLDSATEVLFFQRAIAPALRDELAHLFIKRQILTGSNSGFFIPYASEPRSQTRLFTGEMLRTEFACRHMPLIETTRVLALLAPDNPAAARSIQLSDRRMNLMCYSTFCSKGECRSLTVAYMRYLAALDNEDSAVHLSQFLTALAGHRDGKGKWHGFPFYYTILMLSESDDPFAAHELQYAGPLLERLSGQNWSNDRYASRCQSIVNNAMARRQLNANPLLLGQYG